MQKYVKKIVVAVFQIVLLEMKSKIIKFFIFKNVCSM